MRELNKITFICIVLMLPISCGPKKVSGETDLKQVGHEPTQADAAGEPTMPMAQPAIAEEPSGPFDPPRLDQQLPVPLPVTFPGWPGLPQEITSLSPNGVSVNQLISAAVFNSTVVEEKIHVVIAAKEERQRREDEIRDEIEQKFKDDWAEYQKKRSEGQNPPAPFRRQFKGSEIEHLIDADHLIAAAEFSYSRVAADQIQQTESAYVGLAKNRAEYRSLLAERNFFEKLHTLVLRLNEAGESPISRVDQLAAKIAETDEKLAASRSEQSESSEEIFKLTNMDASIGVDGIADSILADPRSLSTPLSSLIGASIDSSFSKAELVAQLSAADARVRREQWLEVENPPVLPHSRPGHAVTIAVAEARQIELKIDNLINSIASEVTTLVEIHFNDEQRFLAANAALTLMIKSYDDTALEFVNGEHSFSELTEKVEAIIEARHQLNLIRINYLSTRTTLDRLRLTGSYLGWSFDWRDHP